MKILQICHRIPYPPVDGGNIAMMNMALSLHEAGHEVHMFALNTLKHFVEPTTVPGDIKEKLHFQSATIDTSVNIPGILKNFITKDSYNTIRFYSEDAEKKLANILTQNKFDIVQLETLFTAPYIDCIKKNSKAKIVLRAHNAEHIIWQRLASGEKNYFKKLYIEFLTRRLKTFEEKTLSEIDALIPVTYDDELILRRLGFDKPVLTLPVSLNMDEYSYDENEQVEMCLFHLGSMDWMPNLEAVNWFLKNCWPLLHSQFPNLKLYLAGRGMPDEIITAGHPNVICKKRIEDAQAYMRNKRIMIVPLHSGSGIRVKIIQGMALAKTIITTRIGAEGIPATDNQNIFYADTPAEFITTVSRCIQDAALCRKIGISARKFAEENYSNASAGKKLTDFYKGISK